jgi:hypothetical protein
MSKQNLWIDVVVAWERISVLTDLGDERTYYLAPAPLRLLLVCRNGLKIDEMQRQIVDVNIATDDGTPGFARVEGAKQTKITIYRALTNAKPTDRLSRVVKVSHRDPEESQG